MLWVTITMVGRGALPEPQQLEVEPLAGQRVEGAERLVEQQDLRLERERAGEGDALAGPARQLGRPGRERRPGRGRRGRSSSRSRSARRSGGQPASSSG